MSIRAQLRWRVAALVATAIVASTGLVAATTDTYPADDGPTTVARTSSAQVDDAIRFREHFGLRSDRTFVAAAAADTEGFPDTKYGLPLATAELANIEHRQDVQERSEGLIDMLDQQPSFAGMYFDNLDAGSINIMVHGSSDELLDSVQSLIPADATVHVHSAAYGLDELDSVRAAITADYVDGEHDVVDVTRLWIDPRINRVRVGVRSSVDQAEQVLHDRFGEIVSVEADDEPSAYATCTNQTSCGSPMKGGLQIYGWDVGGYIGCTSAFVARPNVGVAQNGLWLLTAGHCAAFLQSGADWYHPTPAVNFIGETYDYEFHTHMSTDAAVIQLSWQTPTNLVWFIGSGNYVSVTSKKNNNLQVLGTVVCRVGSYSANYVCDEITAVDIQFLPGLGVWHDHAWEIGAPVMGGDSGGPVYLDPKAFGIISYARGQSTGYSTIGYTITSFGWRPCWSATTNPCS